MLSDGADQTRADNAFQALATATGKARSPSVERLVGGTSSVTVSLDRIVRFKHKQNDHAGWLVRPSGTHALGNDLRDPDLSIAS